MAEQTRTLIPSSERLEAGLVGLSTWVPSATDSPLRRSRSTTRMVFATSKTGETRPFQTGIAILMKSHFCNSYARSTLRVEIPCRRPDSDGRMRAKCTPIEALASKTHLYHQLPRSV